MTGLPDREVVDVPVAWHLVHTLSRRLEVPFHHRRKSSEADVELSKGLTSLRTYHPTPYPRLSTVLDLIGFFSTQGLICSTIMFKLVQSHFYRDPNFDEVDAPVKQPSRAVDIFVGGQAVVTYNDVSLTGAKQLSVNHRLLDRTSNVLFHFVLCSLSLLTNVDFEFGSPFSPRPNLVS